MSFDKYFFKDSFIGSDQKQIVKYKHFSSSSFHILSGVPQGSHLAPLFFILYLFNLFNILRQVAITEVNWNKYNKQRQFNHIRFKYSKMLLFDGDLKIFREIKNTFDADLL